MIAFVIGIVIGIKVSGGKADPDSYGRQQWHTEDEEAE